MMRPPSAASQAEADRAARAATLCCGLMIASQVAGKATRDALFLSNFPVSALPIMLIVAALFSIGTIAIVSRAQSTFGPGRTTPVAFGLSGFLLLLEWAVALVAPKVAAVVVYLHTAVLGAVLISGFWSVVSERFDPRSAKKQIGRIGAGGTLGGLAGGLLAERVAAYTTVPSMLPVLAALHIAAIPLLRSTRSSREEGSRPNEADNDRESAPGESSGLEILRRVPYLRNLSAVVLLGTTSAALIDYVFKAAAAGAISNGESLMRFFAAFYTVVSLVTFLVQSAATRRFLESFGLGRAVASLPVVVAAGGSGALLLPGLASAAAVRGLEAVCRSSLFRSGYELLYTPISPRDKRAAKPIVDVGIDRAGDMIGGGLTRLIILLPATVASPVLLVIAVLLSGASVVASRRIPSAYVAALEGSLLTRAISLDLDEVEDRTTRTTLLHTLSGFHLLSDEPGPAAAPPPVGRGDEPAHVDETRSQREPAPGPSPTADQIVDLRSGDPARVRKALAGGGPVDPALVPHVISLLGWDEVVADAALALARVASENTGPLIDRLLDPKEEFAVRRRLPRVLGRCPTERSVGGLLQALGDERFEVRFRSGRALSRIRERHPEIPVDRESVVRAVLREVQVGKRIWESQRLLDATEMDEGSLFVDEVLRDRVNRSLEHVFTLLSLVLPSGPLKVSFRGLHTDDQRLRGTALEYLESVLPEAVKKSLWPFLEAERLEPQAGRSRKEILGDLLRSNHSIQLRLEELRRKEPEA